MSEKTALSGKYVAYPEYKDSGVEWFGDIPSHWRVAGFKKYIESIVDYRGKTPSKTDNGVLLVTARNIKKGRLDYSLSQEFIAEEDYDDVMSRGKPNVGDLLFTTEAPLGEVSNVDRTDIALAQRVIKFCGKAGVLNNYYFKYLVMSKEFQQSLYLFASGSTVKGIKAERFVYLRKLLPSFDEQGRIANFLDYETAKIDTLIEKQQQLIKLLKEKRQAVISHAVTKGLNPSAAMRDSGIEWLGEVPEHWGVKRLKDVITVPMKNGLFKKKDQFGSGSLLVNVSDLYVDDYFIESETLDRVKTSADERNVYKVDGGDIFFVRSSLKLEGIGRSACYLEDHDDVVFECHIVNAKPDKKAISSRYLTRYLNSLPVSQEFVRRSKTTTMTTIDQGGLATINVVTPPKNEQLEIDAYLDEKLELMGRAEKRSEDSVKLLTERRTALISAAVTGKIDVRHFNSEDGQSPEPSNTNNKEAAA